MPAVPHAFGGGFRQKKFGMIGEGGDFDLAGFDGVEAEEGAEEFGAACADEAGDAEDFAAAEVDGGVGGFGGAGEVVDFENDFAGGAGERG